MTSVGSERKLLSRTEKAVRFGEESVNMASALNAFRPNWMLCSVSDATVSFRTFGKVCSERWRDCQSDPLIISSLSVSAHFWSPSNSF